MVDGHVEAAACPWVEEPVESGCFHDFGVMWARTCAAPSAERSSRESALSVTKSANAVHGAKRSADGLRHFSE